MVNNYSYPIEIDSWMILSDNHSVKTLDRSAFIHGMTGIPKQIQHFFDIEDMTNSSNRELTITYNGKQYAAKFNKDKSGRGRLIWYKDFTDEINVLFSSVVQSVISKDKLFEFKRPVMLMENRNASLYSVYFYDSMDSLQLALKKLSERSIVERVSDSLTIQEFETTLEYKGGAIRISDAEQRKIRLSRNRGVPTQMITTTVTYSRNQDVVAEALERAKGICEECKSPAPFMKRSDGMPYLEVHHKIPLADGGEDTVENTIAVCPNCHRRLHYGIK